MSDFAVDQNALDTTIQTLTNLKSEMDLKNSQSYYACEYNVGAAKIIEALNNFNDKFNSKKDKYSDKTQSLLSMLNTLTSETDSLDDSLADEATGNIHVQVSKGVDGNGSQVSGGGNVTFSRPVVTFTSGAVYQPKIDSMGSWKTLSSVYEFADWEFLDSLRYDVSEAVKGLVYAALNATVTGQVTQQYFAQVLALLDVISGTVQSDSADAAQPADAVYSMVAAGSVEATGSDSVDAAQPSVIDSDDSASAAYSADAADSADADQSAGAVDSAD